MLRVSSTSAETPGSQGYSFIPTFYINTPLVSRTDILVDPGGTVARVAWLGSTFVPSQNHPTEPRTQTTKENEICGFALLAWEARFFPPMLFRRFINSRQQDPYRTGFSPGRCRFAAVRLLANVIRPRRPYHQGRKRMFLLG